MVVAVAASLGGVGAQDRSPIRVGISTRLTGRAALIGDGDRKSVIMAMEEINAGGGIAGRPVEAVFADNRGVPSEAVAAARKLAEVDQVVAIVDSAGSSGTLAVMPILQELRVVNLAKTSTNPQIYAMSGVGGNPWSFRMNLDDDMIADVYSGFIAQRVRSLSILAYSDDFGRGAAAAYRPRLASRGVRVISEDFFDRGTPDYRPLLSRVKRLNPEGILLVMTAGDAMVFVRQFAELGMTQKIFSRGDIASPEFVSSIKDSPQIAEGWMEATFWAEGVDPFYERRYRARWNSEPIIHGAMAYYALRYILAAAFDDAARAGRIDRETVRQGLSRIAVATPIGTIRFDDHNQAYPNLYIIEIRGGRVVVLRTLRVTPQRR
ncbi:MAG: ABC transporter substrate-binding protein [Armatimonadota bacterium]|nr:ABC transporter substrate-binding protein [Armatimonadota bacterium]